MPHPIGRFVAYDIVPIADFDDGEPQAHPSMAAARRASDATFTGPFASTRTLRGIEEPHQNR
jgi:hypothetical protein